MSLWASGTPCSGPLAFPAASARSAAFAAFSASPALLPADAVSLARPFAPGLHLDRGERVELGLPFRDATEQRPGDFDGRDLAAADRGREVLQGQFRGIAHSPASLRCTATN